MNKRPLSNFPPEGERANVKGTYVGLCADAVLLRCVAIMLGLVMWEINEYSGRDAGCTAPAPEWRKK